MATVKTILPPEQVRTLLRIAPYCRVSSGSDDQQHSFAAQVQYYTELVQKHPDWELVDIYADEGITGTSTERREEFQRLIARLLSDSRYLGSEEFPNIITAETYAMAEQKRQAHTAHKAPVTKEVINEAVVPIYCGKCGAQTKRIRKQCGQKRLCTNLECRQSYRINDARFSEILTELLSGVEVEETIVLPEEKTQELRRMKNDLARMMDMAQPDGEQIRSLIFQIAAKKYEIASFGKHITEKLRIDLRSADLSDFITRRQVMDIAQSITLLSEENMEVTLINGQIIRKEPHHGE